MNHARLGQQTLRQAIASLNSFRPDCDRLSGLQGARIEARLHSAIDDYQHSGEAAAERVTGAKYLWAAEDLAGSVIIRARRVGAAIRAAAVAATVSPRIAAEEALSVRLEDIEHSEYFGTNGGPPLAGEMLHIRQRKRLVAETSAGQSVGNLPTSYNYLASCLKGGWGYTGTVTTSSNAPPAATVGADFVACTSAVSEFGPPPLLVGEVFVDFTVTPRGAQNKLRLGGVAHAARGFWALGAAFRAAVVVPEYSAHLTHSYFASLGCLEFQVLGTVRGAPNVTVIFDPTEVSDQEYETLLRDEKIVSLREQPLEGADGGDALVFPGTYDLGRACSLLPPATRLHLDVAYDVKDADDIACLPRQVETILISTSSDLFKSIHAKEVGDVLDVFHASAPATLILKENRGGSRLISGATYAVEELPAQLGVTANSVGVGDVFAAAYLVHLGRGTVEAGWRATYASARTAQTTYPDLFRTYVQRDLKLTLEEMRELWGAFLPWESRGVCENLISPLRTLPLETEGRSTECWLR